MSGWDGTVKSLGFGVSAMSIPSAKLHGRVPRIMHYMSPEQWLGQPVEARSNLFSLAAVLYEMMTEQMAFDGDTEDEIKQMVLEGTPVAPHQINNKISQDVSAVIMKALSKAPAERFGSGQELVTALEGHKEPTTVAAAKKAKQAPQQPPKGINIPGKDKAAPVAAKPAAPAASSHPAPAKTQPAAASPVTAQATHKQAAAAAAGWGGTGTGSPASEPAAMSTAVEEAPVEFESFKPDPAVVEDTAPASPARKSFSEMDELPPLKEVYVAPPAPVEEVPVATPQLASPAFKPREEKPRIQPKVVAKKAVQEIKKTPPKLFGYAIAGAAGLILLVIAGIAYHIYSQNGDEGSPPPIAAETHPAATQPAPATAQVVAPEPVTTEPDVITIQSKPVPRKVKTAAPTILPGEVTVSSNPDGAQIQLDGQTNGGWVTPLVLSELAPGRHTITLSK